MLTITPEASEAIRVILDTESIPEGAVVRLSAPPTMSANGAGGLAITVVDSAPEEDAVVKGDDVEVSVDPVAAEVLDDKQLDASVADGQVNFTIAEQAPGAD
jgi:Fe-S cluster assembly iron-binding protein IscA